MLPSLRTKPNCHLQPKPPFAQENMDFSLLRKRLIAVPQEVAFSANNMFKIGLNFTKPAFLSRDDLRTSLKADSSSTRAPLSSGI
jgi:hypothetical protein